MSLNSSPVIEIEKTLVFLKEIISRHHTCENENSIFSLYSFASSYFRTIIQPASQSNTSMQASLSSKLNKKRMKYKKSRMLMMMKNG